MEKQEKVEKFKQAPQVGTEVKFRNYDLSWDYRRWRTGVVAGPPREMHDRRPPLIPLRDASLVSRVTHVRLNHLRPA